MKLPKSVHLAVFLLSFQVGTSQSILKISEGMQESLKEIMSKEDETYRRQEPEPCLDENVAETLILTELMANYSKQALPPGKPVVTRVEMHVNGIVKIDELEGTFMLDLMYSEMWKDAR